MGLLSKSQVITRYQIQLRENPTVDTNIIDVVRDGLKKFQMPEFTDDYQELSYGFVPFQNPYNGNFETEQFQFGSYFIFSFRIDRKVIPAKVMERELSIEIQKKKEETGIETMPRKMKSDIKEGIRNKLLPKTQAVPTIYDIWWDYETMQVVVFTNQNAVLDIIETVFKHAFERDITRIFPFSLLGYHDNFDAQKQLRKMKGLDESGRLDPSVAFAKFKFLGADFLRWLWWTANETGVIVFEKDSQLDMWLGSGMTIENDTKEKKSKITIKGEDAGTREAAFALLDGGAISEISFVFMLQGNNKHLQYSAKISADSFCIKGLQTPVIISEVEQGVDALEATVLEKLYLIDKFIQIFDNLFQMFISEYLKDVDGLGAETRHWLKTMAI